MLDKCTFVQYISAVQNYSIIMKKELTLRQIEILTFIEDFIRDNNYAPTLREIATRFNMASVNGAKTHVDSLVRKGFLKIGNNLSRTISVQQNKYSEKNESNVTEIAVIGRIAAGYPLLAEENVDTRIMIDNFLLKNAAKCFGLKVRGDSMIDAGIFEGDIVIANSEEKYQNGDIVVAKLQDEATLKRFLKKDGEYYLMPENKNYEPIPVTGREDFSIAGKVVAVIRMFN